MTNIQYVKVNSLTVMASSSRKAKVLTTIKKGAPVTYLSKKTSWGKIKTASGITGWVANRDLSTTKPAGTAETVSNDKIQYVTSSTLNIRKSGSHHCNASRCCKTRRCTDCYGNKQQWLG